MLSPDFQEVLESLEERLDKLEENPTLRFKKLSPNSRIYKKHEEDSCWDVFATSVNMEHGYLEIGTGLAFDIPKGYEIKAYARSSVSVTPLILANGVGVIDENYKGELILRFKCFDNITTRRYDIGDRVAQIQLHKKVKTKLEEVEELSTSTRGTGGFGSTGTK